MSSIDLPRAAADRNLLFGILAVQLDFVDRDALIAAMNAWVLDKEKSLGQVLADRGVLPFERRALLDALVDEHLRQHGNDARRSLEAVAAHSTVSADLAAAADPDLQATLTQVDPRARAFSGRAAHSRGHNGSRYRRIRPHARGGLGQVFVAEDTELHREVAVKEIQPERADDAGSRTRFILEAEITGALEHPGIVPVYGLGAYADGRPYYAMRFIRGDSLKAAIDQFHSQDWSVRPAAERALAFRSLLRRLIDVCNAVAYAHSRGVLHRDLKPQNVMLGKFGETLVLDWGLAKIGIEPQKREAHEATTDPVVRPSSGSEHAATVAGAALGTPGYMSPEQAAGRLDQLCPASDVYSLGATLYVLLTGQRPTGESSTLPEIEGGGKDAERPSRTLRPPAALMAACAKAMAAETAERYATPLELAADLERWLADEPVTVFTDPWPVRAMRWGRRHRTAVAAGMVFLVSALAAMAIGSGLLWREENRTRNEYERAEREHQAAERNFDTARTTILEMGRQIEAIEIGQAETRNSDLKRKAALDGARKQFEAFVAEKPDDLALKKELAALHRYAGNVSRLLGDYVAAAADYEASLGLWEELARRDPGEASYRDNQALALREAATVQKLGGRLRVAAATLDRAAVLAEEVKAQVPPAWYQRTLATTLMDRSDVEYRLGNFAAAEQAASRAVELYDALKQAPPNMAKSVDPVLAALAALAHGSALHELGKDREALTVLSDAVARAEALGGVRGSRDARHLYNRARLDRLAARSGAGDPSTDAVQELGQVVEGATKLADEYSQSPRYKQVLATALVLRGEFTTRSAPAQAEADYEQALAITRELVDKYGQQADHVGLRARAYLGKGRLQIGQGKKPQAAAAFGAAVNVFKVALEKDPDNFHHRRGLEEAEREAQANPNPAKP